VHLSLSNQVIATPGLAMEIKGKFISANNECAVAKPSFWIFGVNGTIRKLKCVLCEPNMPASDYHKAQSGYSN
jgi:hypothetical protein